MCEQLACGCYLKVERPGVEPRPFDSLVQRPNYYTTRPGREPTNTTTTPLSGTTWISRYQKKHSPTHHPDQHPVFIRFFHLPRSIASSLFKLRAWQSFAQPLSMSSLVYLLVWSPPPHIPYISSPISVFFSQHMPIPSQPVLL